MTTCECCKWWQHTDKYRENFGVCINHEAIEFMKHSARNTYRFDQRALERQLELYDPYVTDKWHRCMFGEERE